MISVMVTNIYHLKRKKSPIRLQWEEDKADSLCGASGDNTIEYAANVDFLHQAL